MSLFKEKSDALKDLEVIRQKRIAADQKSCRVFGFIQRGI